MSYWLFLHLDVRSATERHCDANIIGKLAIILCSTLTFSAWKLKLKYKLKLKRDFQNLKFKFTRYNLKFKLAITWETVNKPRPNPARPTSQPSPLFCSDYPAHLCSLCSLSDVFLEKKIIFDTKKILFATQKRIHLIIRLTLALASLLACLRLSNIMTALDR
jgi:hypothetical protein